MFNYPSGILARFMAKGETLTFEKMWGLLHGYTTSAAKYALDTWQGLKSGATNCVDHSPTLQYIYAEWKECYDQTYDWIHPQLVGLR